MPASAILQPPKKKAKRKAKVAKKRQKIILVPSLLPSPSPSPSPLSSPLPSPSPSLSPSLSPSPSALVTPAEPISADKVNKGEDKNTEEPIEVEDKDIDLLPPLPPPVRFTSVWKAVISSKNKSLPGTKSAMFNTKNIYYFELDLWQDKIIQRLLPRKFKITQLQAIASYKKAWRADCCP